MEEAMNIFGEKKHRKAGLHFSGGRRYLLLAPSKMGDWFAEHRRIHSLLGIWIILNQSFEDVFDNPDIFLIFIQILRFESLFNSLKG